MGGPDLRQVLKHLENQFNVSLTPLELRALPRYLALLQKWNRHINLTADSDPEVVLRRHIFEGLWAGRSFLSGVRKLADIGSGAGFPGLFLALSQPSCHVLLIERQHKRVAFLRTAVQELELDAQIFAGSVAEYSAWDAIEMASIRAVRLDQTVLKPLEAAQIPLLWFHSEGTTPPSPPWRVGQSQLVPASQRRRVTVLTPAGLERFT